MAGPAAKHGSGMPPHAARVHKLEGEAQGLADRLPELMLEVNRVTTTVSHGIHGRRRAGPGETFWQFRQYQTSDAAQTIDWRRSASSDHLYVREREWEAAHTVWLWSDVSASMNFRSDLAAATKRDRGLVLMMALAELLVRGGERVALLGLLPPMASRNASLRIAGALASHGEDPNYAISLPPAGRLSRYSGAVFVSDFLDPVDKLAERLVGMAHDGVNGHLVQVLDPAEETLPYEGRAEFLGLEGNERWVADRVEALRPLYQEKLAAHRAELAALARRLGWTLLVHHTDRPATELLLSLILRLQGADGSYRWSAKAEPKSTEPRGGAA
jgi:uncharacterized protein (DUF58 family)